MKVWKVKSVEVEADRLLNVIKIMKYNCNIDKYTNCYNNYNKYTAAVRRSSMDLTRALAELRRG